METETVHVCPYPDFSGDRLPDVRTRSNRTLVLLSSGGRSQSFNIRKFSLITKRTNFFFFFCTNVTIKMREVIDVGQNVLWDVTVFFQTQLKDLEGHRFILWG